MKSSQIESGLNPASLGSLPRPLPLRLAPGEERVPRQPRGRQYGGAQGRPLPTPPPAARGVLCHGHCQVARSQVAGLSCQGKEAARRPPRSGSPSVPSGCSSFLSPSPRQLPSLPRHRRWLRPRLPPRSIRGVLPPLPTPPAHHSLPREAFHSRVQAGTPDWVECWKNNLSLRFKRLNS